MEIQLFNSPQFGQVRTAGTPDNPLFCLADVCKAVELTNPSSVKGRLDAEDVQLIDLHTLNSGEGSFGTNPYANFVTESGLFDVILQSSSPRVKPFRKWVTSEVLPSIRKNGGYITTTTEDTPEEIMAKAVLLAQKTIETQKQKLQVLEGRNALLEQENKEIAPKAKYFDEVLQSTDTYTFEQMAKQLNFRSVQKFTRALIEKKICYKRSDTYMLYADYAGNGYTTPRTHRFFHRDGTPGSRTSTVWTEKGRMFLHEKFNVAMQPVDLTMFTLDTI